MLMAIGQDICVAFCARNMKDSNKKLVARPWKAVRVNPGEHFLSQ